MKLLSSIIISLFITTSANAFILVSETYKIANHEEVIVNITNDGCGTITNAELLAALNDAVEGFWNTVSESSLYSKVGGVVAKTISSSPDPGEILVGCDNTLGATTGGVTSFNSTNNGALIRMNSSVYSSVTGGFSSTLVHEMGHAYGLNHSKDPASVMTYEDNGWDSVGPAYLARDDKNGITYLYPVDKELGGFMGGCGTIRLIDSHLKSEKGNKSSFWQGLNFSVLFILGFLLISIAHFLIRRLKNLRFNLEF